MLSSVHWMPDPGPTAVGSVEEKRVPTFKGARKISNDTLEGQEEIDRWGEESLAGRRKMKALGGTQQPKSPI